MTLFISWPISQDAAFRAAYEAQTGEVVQAEPQQSDDGLTYTVGSSRCTLADIDALRDSGFDVTTMEG